jgi:peptide/nickel transport system substrate-binding protein
MIGRRLRVLAVWVLALLVASACGDDDGGAGDRPGASGGSIRIGTVGPDEYDPVLFQTLPTLQALAPVYTGLLTFRHASGEAGARVIPGLAEQVPEPTNGGKTYEFRLRDGLEYSDGSPVRASDFENTIKRLLKLAGPYSSFFTGIAGATEFQEEGDFDADIPGIETNDRTGEIRIDLTEPDTKLAFALAEPYAAPTPAAKSPPRSLSDAPPPGVGPYRLEVVDPSREFVLTRNPRFDIPGLPKGNLDRITGLVMGSVPRMTQDVIRGRLDYMTEDPAGDLLPLVRQKYPDRFREDPNPPNTYYFFLNVTIPPFDSEEAREAVNYAVDSRALVRVFGYEELDCKYGDPDGGPDLERARELVERSGHQGEKVTVWTSVGDPWEAIADYYRDVLDQIGFDAETKALDQQVYFEQTGLRRTRAQTGFTSWIQDFPHPGDFFEPLLGADALSAEPTLNSGFVSDPHIEEVLDELRGEDPTEVADQWAELDDYVVNDKAYVVPYGNEKTSTFFSERMDFERCAGVHPVWKNDWTEFCLK